MGRRLLALVLLVPLTLACAVLSPPAAETPTPIPTPTTRPVPALFAAQATRFIELGTTIVATAPSGTLPTFRAQVGEMKGILTLLEQTGGDLFTDEAREFAHKAIARWNAAVESWETLGNVIGAGRSGFKALDYMDSAIVPFNSAKLRLLALLK